MQFMQRLLSRRHGLAGRHSGPTRKVRGFQHPGLTTLALEPCGVGDLWVPAEIRRSWAPARPVPPSCGFCRAHPGFSRPLKASCSAGIRPWGQTSGTTGREGRIRAASRTGFKVGVEMGCWFAHVTLSGGERGFQSQVGVPRPVLRRPEGRLSGRLRAWLLVSRPARGSRGVSPVPTAASRLPAWRGSGLRYGEAFCACCLQTFRTAVLGRAS